MLKPDWATMLEWDGWKPETRIASISHRNCHMAIHCDGFLSIFDTDLGRSVNIFCKSPEAARKAAEALLEAME